MRKDTKADPIIGRKVIALCDIENWRNDIIKKGTLCTIREFYRYDEMCYIKSIDGIIITDVPLDKITDDFKLTITHYECIKDGKVILFSDEPIEVESIEEFKANAKRLMLCDEVKVEFEKIDTDG